MRTTALTPAFAATLACAWALAAPPARALEAGPDLATPVRLADRAVQIGTRTVQLPPGDWTLVHVKEVQLPAARELQILTAWAVLLQGGRFAMAMQLSLPLGDMGRDRRLPDNPCTARDGVLRGDYSHGRSEMECLAVFGHHALGQVLQQRSPRTARWLARQGVGPLDDGVEFTYSHREGTRLGRVALYFPAQAFASDDAAAAWAAALREAFEPLVERRVTVAALPPLAPPATSDERR